MPFPGMCLVMPRKRPSKRPTTQHRRAVDILFNSGKYRIHMFCLMLFNHPNLYVYISPSVQEWSFRYQSYVALCSADPPFAQAFQAIQLCQLVIHCAARRTKNWSLRCPLEASLRPSLEASLRFPLKGGRRPPRASSTRLE